MKPQSFYAIGLSLIILALSARGETRVVVEHNRNEQATPAFRFSNVPAASKHDAATKAKFAIVDGERDPNGAELSKLQDGRTARSEDQPSANFFFNAGTDGGRLLIDLERTIEIKQVNTYSWHRSGRGPQLYKLYASSGETPEFNAQPKRDITPESCGWKLIATIDTRENEPGGQYGVSISDPEGTIGSYRYLLLAVSRTDAADRFSNTFFSEIDVIDRDAPPVVEEPEPEPPPPVVVQTDGGKYHFTIDASAAPDLREWAEQELAPVVLKWYPKIVEILPSDGFEPPDRLTILFREDMGGTPASASGNRINCNASWFRRNLKGEARGSVVHEMVHVVQQYGRARRTNPNATRIPGWLVEGIPDYIRWFLYEPETKGAEITQRNLSRARYDASYRITGNFLNWAIGKYDKGLVLKLNAAAREGRYHEELWKEFSGKTLPELGEEWRAAVEEKLTAKAASSEAPIEAK